jgi:hypothetical protein
MHRIFTTSVASVYPHYVAKVERKGRTEAELDEVIEWLTGYDAAELQRLLAAGTTFEQFFDGARLNPNASSITGVVCGIRVEDVEDPPDAEDPLPRQARGRARQGQGDGEDPAHLSAAPARADRVGRTDRRRRTSCGPAGGEVQLT